jgi:hypothetical protein
MTPIKSLFAKLSGVRQAGNGWSARCPAHKDKRASLSVAEGEDGRALVKCHAGCTVDAIAKAVGLTVRDLMPERSGPSPNRDGESKPSGRTFPTASAAVADLERRQGKRSAQWNYHDAHSDLVGLVIRWDVVGGNDIRPVARSGDGWRIGAMPEPRPLYGLPEIAKARRVIVTEGEKTADAARSLGFVATTSAAVPRPRRKLTGGPCAARSSGFSRTTMPPAELTQRPWPPSWRG